MPPIFSMSSEKRIVYSEYRNSDQKMSIRVDNAQDINDFLITLIRENLRSSKKTLLIYDNDSDVARVIKHLANFEMSKYGIIWTPEFIEKMNPISRIHAFQSSKTTEFDKDRLRVLKNQKEDFEKILNDRYDFLRKEVLPKFEWKDLFEKWCKLDHDEVSSFDTKIELPSDINLSEFLYEVGEAEEGYREHFVLLHQIMPFHKEVCTTLVDSDTLMDELEARAEELQEVSNLITKRFNQIKKELSSSLNESYQKLSYINDQLVFNTERINARMSERDFESTLVTDVVSSSEFEMIHSLSKNLDSTLKDLKEFNLSSFTHKPAKWTVADFNLMTDELQVKLVSFQAQLDSNIQNKISRLGPHSIDDSGLSILFDKLDQFINDLNESCLLRTRYNENALTFSKKIEHAALVAKDLKQAIVFLENNSEYVLWLSGLSVELRNLVVTDLSYCKESWRSVVLKRVLNEYLKSSLDPSFDKINSIKEDLIEVRNEFIKMADSNIHNIQEEARSQALKNLKTENSDFYKRLVNMGADGVSLFDVLSKAPDLLTTFFPVVSTSAVQFSEVKDFLAEDIWDDIIVFNGIPLESSRLHIYTENSTSQIDPDFELEGTELRPFVNLSDANLSERYDLANNVIKSILSESRNASLFKMKGISILSCLSLELENLFSQQFIPQGIKCLHRKVDNPEYLIEGLVDGDDKIFVIIENGAIGDFALENFYWNSDIISSFEKIGIEVIDINFAEIFFDTNEVLKSIKQTILGGMKHQLDAPAYAAI